MQEIREYNGLYDHLPGMKSLMAAVLGVFREAERSGYPWMSQFSLATHFILDVTQTDDPDFLNRAVEAAILALIDRGLLKSHPDNAATDRSWRVFGLTSPLELLAEI
jgi:hypothetical protein